jgi:hypothetical protein
VEASGDVLDVLRIRGKACEGPESGIEKSAILKSGSQQLRFSKSFS